MAVGVGVATGGVEVRLGVVVGVRGAVRVGVVVLVAWTAVLMMVGVAVLGGPAVEV